MALTVLELGGGPLSSRRRRQSPPVLTPAVTTEIAEGRDGAMDAAARCAGRNGVRTYSSWWQGTVTVVMLNSCNANRLANALWVGAGIATLVGILSVAGAVPAGIAGAVLAIGAGAIGWCTSNGTGLEIHKAYYGSWCTNQ